MNNSSLNNPDNYMSDYSAIYTVPAFPFTADVKCYIFGLINRVNEYADIYATINGVTFYVNQTNVYNQPNFIFELEAGDTITFNLHVSAGTCRIIPIKRG